MGSERGRGEERKEGGGGELGFFSAFDFSFLLSFFFFLSGGEWVDFLGYK